MKKSIVLLFCYGCYLTICGQPSINKIQKSINQARVDWGVPGLSVGIVYQGETYLNQGFGFMEQGKRATVNAETQYAIASNTKAFVSAALGILVMDEKLNWDDPVRKYLPDFAMYDPYVSEHLTIKDLLCHRGGLGTFSGDVIWYKSTRTAAEVVKSIRHVPQAYEFRGGYGYSNLMFITAGEVIRSITGMNWDDYLQIEIFDKISMDETVTSTEKLSTNSATPHKPIDGINEPIRWVNWDNMGAAGGIISSSDDMTQWIQLLLNQGIWEGDTLIDPDILHQLWTPHNTFALLEKDLAKIPGRNFNGYGLGWGIFDYFGRKVMTHSGGYDGMYSRVVLVPQEALGFVILTNSMTGISNPMMFELINQFIKEDTRDWHTEYLNRPAGEGMSDWIAERKSARKADTKPRLSMDEYAGEYFDPMYGTITVTSSGDQLQLSFEKAPALSAILSHWQYDTWKIEWNERHAWFDFGLLSFTLDAKNEITEISFDVPNYDIFFDEIHAKRK